MEMAMNTDTAILEAQEHPVRQQGNVEEATEECSKLEDGPDSFEELFRELKGRIEGLQEADGEEFKEGVLQALYDLASGQECLTNGRLKDRESFDFLIENVANIKHCLETINGKF